MDSDLDRPGTQGSMNRRAWDQGNETSVVPAGGPGADPYQYDNDAIEKKGCWYTFSTCVSRMWATRQMTKKRRQGALRPYYPQRTRHLHHIPRHSLYFDLWHDLPDYVLLH